MADSQNFSGSAFGAAGFVTALPDTVRERLLAHGRTRCFAKGELIQQRGDPGREFWYILTGSVQIGRFSVDGELTLFALLGPGESFGEQAFLGEFPRLVDAIAGTETKLVQVGEKELEAAIASDPSVVRILLKAMAHMVQRGFDLVEAGRNLSTVDRVAQALLQHCNEGEYNVTITVTQQSLADLVGVSRVSLGKALDKIEDSGLISRRYGRIIVRDRGKLSRLLGD
ncbi:Crp/Fnr family transcriptional regulator [Sphingorhabdus sp. Alg231-15]|uniref:Crp/Fnr family transcriptional regulator n=1 Tax=Sphingorhabdus sp. Alg231-15 TaxID=1922222 RepID=UPI00307BEBF7